MGKGDQLPYTYGELNPGDLLVISERRKSGYLIIQSQHHDNAKTKFIMMLLWDSIEEAYRTLLPKIFEVDYCSDRRLPPSWTVTRS